MEAGRQGGAKQARQRTWSLVVHNFDLGSGEVKVIDHRLGTEEE